MWTSTDHVVLDDMDENDEDELNRGLRMYYKSSIIRAYCLFFILGIGNILPWHVFSGAVDYWNDTYKDFPVEIVFAWANMTGHLISCFVLLFVGRKLSFAIRVNSAYGLFLVLMFFAPLSHLLGSVGAWIVIIGAFGNGCITAVCEATTVGMASCFPKNIFMSPLEGGFGVAGTIAVFLRVASKLTFPNNSNGVQTSSYIFFALGAVIEVVAIVAFNTLLHLKYVRLILHNDQIPSSFNQKAEAVDSHSSYAEIWKTIWKESLLLGATYAQTLFVYPGVLSRMDTFQWTLEMDWYPVILMVAFNIADVFGRLITPCFPSNKIFPCFLVFLFRNLCVLFFLISLWVPLSELFSILLVSLFGATGGYNTVVLLKQGTDRVGKPQKELSGVMMILCLGIGLFLGAGLAMLLVIKEI